jgi:serpin B
MKKMIRNLTNVLPGVALGFCAACTPPQPVTCKAPAATPSTLSSVETGNSEFASSLLTQLAQKNSGPNFFYSPYSISAALAMTYNGAATQTAQQMAQVLNLPQTAQDVPLAYADLDCQIETNGQENGNQLNIANGLFGQQGFPFLASFLNVLQSDYNAPLQQVDFENNPNGATQTVDQWVSNETSGQIPQLFAPGSLDSSTRLVLAEAIYFKGNWASAFNPSNTNSAPFTVSSSQQVQASFMNQSGSFGYATVQAQSLTVLEMPYTGGKLAMDVLLPDAPDGLPALLSSFSAANFSSWVSGLQSAMVQVSLPKLKLNSSFNLNPILQTMGMVLAFDPNNADFSGIDGAHDLFIEQVVHQATLEVDESGTVAAAATGVGVGDSVAPQFQTFNANHPFLVVLRDLGTGTLLFIGEVSDPTQS